jgi:acetamidase/formamidase
MTITPDAHGGNMDTPELRAGVTVYFGVNVDGALFALGDAHARQGHGEVSGVAVECAMRTTLVVELLKGVPTPWPPSATCATPTTPWSRRWPKRYLRGAEAYDGVHARLRGIAVRMGS